MKYLPSLLVILFGAYWLIAGFAYRFRHPEKTETQLILETPKALLFK